MTEVKIAFPLALSALAVVHLCGCRRSSASPTQGPPARRPEVQRCARSNTLLAPPRGGAARVKIPGQACYNAPMQIEFSGKIWFWRGPAPWYFVTVPEQESGDIKAISNFVTYGWGVIPVQVRIGKTDYTTSLFPKDDRYLVPIKVSVRKAENLEEGDEVAIRLEVRPARR